MENSTLPLHECDLIMKGGITSGIVYPKAIARLAQHYRLRSIGGASAGAIAAACAAAAELGRTRGHFGSMAAVEAMPAALAAQRGGKPLLQRLFKAEPGTRRYLDTLLGALVPEARPDTPIWNRLTTTFRVVWGFAKQFPMWAIVGLILSGWLAYFAAHGAAAVCVWPLVGLLTLLGGLFVTSIVLVVRAVAGLMGALKRNHFGLVTGMGHRDGSKLDDEALTPWLYQQLQSLSGTANGPLTFGSLWGTRTGPAHERKIDLRLMTTLLSQRRGLSFPLPEHEKFYFSPQELKTLFPADVVRHLIEHARQPSSDNARTRQLSALLEQRGLCRLPLMADLPVIVAVRMSLAFPVLLCPVPLYVQQFTNGVHTLERVWFADGGIISNFPIHYFDALIPSRPTFGINLRDARPGVALETPEDFIALDRSNHHHPPHTTVLGAKAGAMTLLGWVFDTLHNWTDQGQMATPGFRDRIVHITLKSDEGGLNLRMGPKLIEELAHRGDVAAARLLLHFHPDFAAQRQALASTQDKIQTTWANHIWVRYRVAAQLLEQALLALHEAEQSSKGHENDIRQFHNAEPSYPFDSTIDRDNARDGYEQIVELAKWFMDENVRRGKAVFDGEDVPKPRAQLRILPRD